MQIDYDGSHSITFYDYRAVGTNDASMSSHTYNTWTSWHLVPTSAPTLKLGEAKISMASVAGSTAVVDMSEALTGSVLKGRHTGEWEFIIDTEREKKTPWQMYYKIRNAIHGKWLAVKLDDDHVTYTGRITISSFNIGKEYATIKISANLGNRGSSTIGTRGAGT